MSSPLPAARACVPCLCALALLAGCGAPPRPPAPLTAAPAPAPIPSPERLPEGATITLGELLRLAQRQAPGVEAMAAMRSAALAATRQAGAWANPELELRSGNSRARSGEAPDQRTWGAELRQRVELPGKRSSRIAAARAGLAVAGHEGAQLRLDLDMEVRSAAVALCAAQLALARATSSAELAAALRQTVEHRTQAGELAKADLARARLEETTAGLAVVTRQREVRAALYALRSWCGAGLPEIFTVSDALPEEPAAIPLDAALRQAQERHPRLRLLAAQVEQRSAELRHQRLAWLPDLTLGVSNDRTADSDELGVSLGFELPLWNQGDGAMDAAEAARSLATAALRSEQQALERAVLAAWNAYESARLELAALSTQASSAAAEAVRLRQAAYAAGEDSLADLLEARRAAQAVADAILAARRSAAEAAIALGRASGAFPTTPSEGSQP